MTRIPGGVEPGELLNAVVVVLLGVLSVAWIMMILRGTASLYSPVSTVLLASLVGAVLGLLPWGLPTTETLWGRVFLLYLTSAFVAGGIAIAATSLAHAPFVGGAALVAFVGGGVYFRSGAADHVLFVPIWICLVSVYLLGIVGLGRAVFLVENLFPVLVGIGVTAVVVATHQALIRERSRYLS